MTTTIYRGGVAPEAVTFRVDGANLQSCTAANIRVKPSGSGSATSWIVDDIARDDRGVTLTHTFRSTDWTDQSTNGDYYGEAILTVVGGTVRSAPVAFVIADPLP